MVRGTTSLLGFSIKIRTKHNKGTTLCWGGGVKGKVVPGPLFLTFLFLHPSLSVVLGLRLESQIIRRRRAVASGMGNSFFEDGFANKRLSSWRMVIGDIMDFVQWLCYF